MTEPSTGSIVGFVIAAPTPPTLLHPTFQASRFVPFFKCLRAFSFLHLPFPMKSIRCLLILLTVLACTALAEPESLPPSTQTQGFAEEASVAITKLYWNVNHDTLLLSPAAAEGAA